MDTTPLLSTAELADYLGVPVATVHRWRYTRTGPTGYAVGRHVRYRLEDVDRWLASRADPPRPVAS